MVGKYLEKCVYINNNGGNTKKALRPLKPFSVGPFLVFLHALRIFNPFGMEPKPCKFLSVCTILIWVSAIVLRTMYT